jgi:hypothetical protein
MGFSCFSKIPKDGYKVKVNVAVYEIKEYSYTKEGGKTVTRKGVLQNPIRPGIYHDSK